MSVLEATLEDTGQLRKIAEENYRARTRPVDVGPIVVTAALALAAGMWAYPALDADRFSIDGSRWVMAVASVLSAVVATACGVYVLDRRSKKRTDLLMATLETMRSVACHNASAIGRLAAQVEQLDARLNRRAQFVAHIPQPDGSPTLPRSEYWKLYEDVMTDLGGIPPTEGDGGD